MPQPFPFDDPKLKLKTRADAEFLIAHGWVYETRSRGKYGWHYYWEHEKHRPRNGYWLTQGQAVDLQKRINRRKKAAV